MPTIEQQLNELVKQKNALATALRDKGVEAEENETLNSLVEKVEGLEVGGPIVPVDNYSELTGVFNLHTSIKHVDIPDGVIEIYGYYSSTGYHKGCFYECESLESVLIPSSVTTIGSNAFAKTGIKLINIPENVTTINERAFMNCDNLETVILPTSITTLAKYSFGYCSNLKTVYYKGSSSQWSKINRDSSWMYKSGSNVTGGTQIIYDYTG